jgi:unspecific monooxygenase
LPPELQARLWLEAPGRLLESAHREFGDIFMLQLGRFGTIVIVADPEAVQQVFATTSGYECRHFNESYRYAMGRHALFLKDGEAHRQLKRLLAPLFRGEGIERHGPRIAAVAGEAAASWQGTVAMRPFTQEIALRSLLRLVFGDDRAAEDQVVGWFHDEVWQDLRSWKPWTNLSRLHPRLRALISAELDRRRDAPADGREPDLLDSLLATRTGDGEPLSDDEIQDQVLMLTITAGDAVAMAVSWALYRAARHPEVQERLRGEVAALGPDADAAEVARLPYLSATVQEVLRLHTILPTVSGRRLTEPREVRGYRLEPGVTLAPCEYLVHRRADRFEDPLEFRPERFLGQSWPLQEYFPFGGGVRGCLGGTLAPLTIKLVLATILSRARLAVASDEMPGTVRYGTLLAPEEDLVLEVTPA